jgi:CheY-like chemotaxis protein
VLVVDDNEDVLELFQRYLVPHQYRVVTAKAVQEGLDLAIRLQPDTITLDLMMPEQDGWDLLQALLNRPDTRHIPIIVCSVLKQKELALSLGATAFLKKPVTELQLLSALQALEEA